MTALIKELLSPAHCCYCFITVNKIFSAQSWMDVFSPCVILTIILHKQRWDNLHSFSAWVLFALYIMGLTYFPFKQCQIPCEWLNISEIHLPPDDHILHLVFHIALSKWISLPEPLSHFLPPALWASLRLFLSLSPVIYHSTGGLAWPSSLFCLDDSEGQWQSGALAGAQRVWICVFPLGVLCSDVKRGYVIYVWLKGVSTAESQSLKKRGLYCVNACVRADAGIW